MTDDIVRRQAAITAVLELDVSNRVSWKDAVIDAIDALPEIIRCKDCKHHDSGKPGMVYCQNLDCWVSVGFFCKDGERSVEDGCSIIPGSRADKPDHSECGEN